MQELWQVWSQAMNCQEKKRMEETHDTNTNIKCHFSGKCIYCGKVCHRINEYCNKKAAEEKQKLPLMTKKGESQTCI